MSRQRRFCDGWHVADWLTAVFWSNLAGLPLGLELDCSGTMGREERTNIPGGIYHVMNRGNRKAPIFEDDRDRRQFFRHLIREQEIYGVETLAGALMPNHFHLVLQTPNGNLSEFMEQLEGSFAHYSNRRYHRVGHVFQDRFRDVVIENDVHLLTALCYVFMNPVAARLVEQPQDYQWSTYAATVGLRPLPAFLTLDWLESLLPAGSLADSQRAVRKLMETGNPVWEYFESHEFNVNPEFVKQVIRSYTGEQLYRGTLPRAYRGALRPSLEELLLTNGSDRGQFVTEARTNLGYTNTEIAKALKLHPGTVSKIFCAHRTKSAGS